MTQSIGCSTPAPSSSVAKQWTITSCSNNKEEVSYGHIIIYYMLALDNNDFLVIVFIYKIRLLKDLLM